MGMIPGVLRGGAMVDQLGQTAKSVVEVFRPNATKGMELTHKARADALAQLSKEFAANRKGLFNSIVDGLNRLPRPLLALGTLGLFVYAMTAPDGFARRMAGLAYVPDPLWWLLGAVVGFYFGARELHYMRSPNPAPQAAPPAPDPVSSSWHADAAATPVKTVSIVPEPATEAAPEAEAEAEAVAAPSNPALSDWTSGRG